VRFAVLVVLPACSFSAHSRPAHDADADSVSDARDAAVDATADAAIDGGRVAFCDPTDPTLIACYAFEGTTADGSPHHLDANGTNVTFVAGKVGMAAVASASTQMTVAQSPLIDPPTLTIEAWIKAPTPGLGARAGIIDNEGAWGFFLHEQGELQCITATNVAANVPADTWTYVACTADGTNRKIYVNGVLVETEAAGLLGGGTQGMALGANSPSGQQLGGDIDQLRLFNTARTAAQIAADMAQR